MSNKSRRWVKLWHEVMNDTKFHDMPLDQQARWYNLLVYTSCHGDAGFAIIPSPARLLVHQLHCVDFDDMVSKIEVLVNVQIAKISHAEISVTFPKWNKYQVDSTVTERKRRQRSKNVTPKEKEKEEEKDIANGEIRSVIDYYFEKYKNCNGGNKPIIDGKDAKLVELRLKEFTSDGLKVAIDYYMTTPKFKDYPTLSAALSKMSMMVFEQRNK